MSESRLRIRLQALGCRLNEAELEGWARDFQQAGHHVVGENEAADVLVLNTCAVTGEAVRKSRQLVRRLHRDNPAAKLVLSGCYATLQGEEAANLPGVDLVVDNAAKDRLAALTGEHLALPSMPALASEPGETALFTRGRNRAFIKVQDGCRYRCTFCIVTIARGEERSRPVADIVAQINALHAQGIHEAVLTGVHVGGYGSDTGSSLDVLIRAILADTDLPRLRLASVEPWELSGDFFALFENPRLMPHLHLPLQSGADSVLRRMARRCRSADFAALVERARAAVTGFHVTTDVIVGFPGETEAEWQETLAFVERIGFGHLHIFSYSPRAGTKAARLPHPVPAEIKRARSHELHALGAQLKRAHLEAQLGEVQPVLFEGVAREATRVFGYTPNYSRVAVDTSEPARLVNRLAAARLDTVDENGTFIHAQLVGRAAETQRRRPASNAGGPPGGLAR